MADIRRTRTVSAEAQHLAEHIVCRVTARQSDVLLAGLANRLEGTRA